MAAHESAAFANDAFAAHRRAGSYTYRVPTPPRIVIPPPIDMIKQGQELDIGNIIAPDDPQIDLSFLNQVDYTSLGQANNSEWTYEWRRQAQMIIPYLYLGPSTVAKDKDFLVRTGITMMLGVRPKVTASSNAATRAAAETSVEFRTVEAPTVYALISALPTAIQTINQHLHKIYAASKATGTPRLGKVLVFCETGNDKSAALVAAYLTEMISGCNHIQAMQICQAQRFCVNFDDATKQMLQTYDGLIQARRLVAQGRPPTTTDLSVASATATTPAAPPKRRVDETYDEDMDEDMPDDDYARFEGRTFTPFMD